MADANMLKSWYEDYKGSNGFAKPEQTTTADPAVGAAPTQAPAPMQGMLRGPAVAQATTNEWKPDENSTVAGQVNKITSAGSPLIDQATTAAKQQMAPRGLLNSSLGVTAGLDAAYRTALPIAQQDAATFANAGQFNAGAANTTSQFNASALNTAESQRAGFEQQSKLQAADFAQQTKTQEADLASRYDLAKMDVESRAALQAADAANQQKLQQANAELQKGLQASDAAVKQSMQVYDGELKKALQGLDNQSRLELATLDADNKVTLAGIEAKYRNQLQSNQSMAASYQSMVDSFTRVMTNPDMDAAAKQAAIGNLTTLYNNTLQMQSDVSGLQLGTLLTPGAVGGTPAASPAPAAAPAPAPRPAPGRPDDISGGA